MMTCKSHNVQVLFQTMLLGIVCSVFFQTAQAQAPGIVTSGNKFVTTSAGSLGYNHTVTKGESVVLRGINVSGSEYSCLGDGTDDGSATVWDSSNLPANTSDYQTVVSGMINDWHANIVRIPLNEDCWLGVPTTGQSTMLYGSSYITPIVNFVNVANASGMVAEVDLHVGGGPELVNAKSNQIDNFPAMDTNYSLQFWESAAQTFANNPAVIFNLTNEPEFAGNGGSGDNVAEDWSCYVTGSYNGTQCNTSMCYASNQCEGPNGKSNTWNVQGVASVVTAIRNTEKTYSTNNTSHVIIVGGLDYSNELNDWLTYVPANLSSMTNIAAGVHIYYDLDCETASCWSTQEGGILAANYPVAIDETGELPKSQGGDGCTGTETKSMVSWANSSSPEVGYWFWAFTKNGGCAEPVLLKTNASPFTPASGYGAEAQSALTAIQ
jgi:endoglucanase